MRTMLTFPPSECPSISSLMVAAPSDAALKAPDRPMFSAAPSTLLLTPSARLPRSSAALRTVSALDTSSMVPLTFGGRENE